jgi:hypothetical protein
MYLASEQRRSQRAGWDNSRDLAGFAGGIFFPRRGEGREGNTKEQIDSRVV